MGHDRADQLRYVNAGHNAPYLLRAGRPSTADSISPEIEQLSVGGTVVRMFPEMEYEEATMSHGSWPSSGHHPSPRRACGLHAYALLAVPALWRPHPHLNHQAFCAGLAREQELEHDLQLYRGYEQARRGCWSAARASSGWFSTTS